MKDLNIGSTIIHKRKDKGITQEDLAAYIGVSKASVSKWETGQSYPDIAFLPQLAAYFNISIDELLGYEPQMTTDDIHVLYHRFAREFASRPLDDVLDELHEVIKKYFSCFPLLLQMSQLLVNVSVSVPDAEKRLAITGEARDLCSRVKTESGDPSLSQQALLFEAYCCIALGNSNEALILLEGIERPQISPEPILSLAFQATGQFDKARATSQVGIYQHLMGIISLAPSYLQLCLNDRNSFEEVYRRIEALLGIFALKELNPGQILSFELAAAAGYASLDDAERTLDVLETYTAIATSMQFPLRLQGDEFFDTLDAWLKENDYDTAAPRDDTLIMQDIVNTVTESPVFAPFAGDPRFKKIAKRLKSILG